MASSRAGKPITAKARPSGENVVNLMEALRKSCGGAALETRAAEKKPVKKRKKAAAGQKEMLMPISGKQPAKEAVAKKPAAKPQRKSAWRPSGTPEVASRSRHAVAHGESRSGEAQRIDLCLMVGRR